MGNIRIDQNQVQEYRRSRKKNEKTLSINSNTILII